MDVKNEVDEDFDIEPDEMLAQPTIIKVGTSKSDHRKNAAQLTVIKEKVTESSNNDHCMNESEGKEENLVRYVVLPRKSTDSGGIRVAVRTSSLRDALTQFQKSNSATPTAESAQDDSSTSTPSEPQSSGGTQTIQIQAPIKTKNQFKWTEFYRRALINSCIENNIKRLAYNKKWQKIADLVNEQHGLCLTKIQCKNQWQNELQRYRNVKNPPIGSTPKTYAFFDLMHDHLSTSSPHHSTVRPTNLISTFTPPTDLSASFIGDVSESTEPLPKQRKIANEVRNDIFSMVKDYQRQNNETKEFLMSKYNEILEKNSMLLERLIRLDEKRVENESKLIRIEERRVENEARSIRNEERRQILEEKMLNILQRLM